jgi:FixJ family two-component response regulator
MKHKADVKIFIIDDNESVRRSFSLLLMSAGYIVEAFENVSSFLETAEVTGPGCILLDIFLQEESGLDFQDAISEKFPALPIIYITGQGDIPMSVRALKHGALDFLQKPVDETLLFNTVEEAIELSKAHFDRLAEKSSVQKMIDALTPREFEIFRLLLKGMLNKQIADELKIAEHTVKLHRGKITGKLGVKSVAEMVYLAEKLNIK